MRFSKSSVAAFVVGAIALTEAVAGATPVMARGYPGNYSGPGVANVSVANGNVVIVRGGSGAQVGAAINAPILPGDYIATGPGSRAEVQFDGISTLRLAQNTQVRFVNLSPSSREMLLAAGTVDLAELQGADGGPQIDTPQLTVRPDQSGDYRVSVLGDGRTLVTARSGSANVASNAGSQTLTPGGTLVAYGPYSNPSISMQRAVTYDSFDQFDQSRDQALVSAYNSNPYLSPQLAGYSNFANYGQWQNVPGYGYAWAPNNQSQSNFAPYQNGQWTSEPNYGYTWVPNEPWGYAPSHYGTWFNNSSYGGWLWQPPAYQSQASSSALSSAWLPALVAFFMNGNNGGALGSIGSLFGNSANPYGNANIGWIPLAPGEQYQPWYGDGQAGYNQPLPYPPTTMSNVTNIYNYYSNAQYPGGATIVPVSAWRNGNFQRHVTVRPQQLRRLVLVRGAIPVVPTTANLRYSRSVAVKRPLVLARTFVTNSRFAAKAPALARSSFTAQQAQFKKIVSVKPKVVHLAPRAAVVRPVYHPPPHPPVHLTTTVKSARHTAHKAKPAMRPAPAPKPASNPVHAPKAVVHPAAAPIPVVHPKSIVHPAAVPKPFVHPAAVPKPVVHPAAAPQPAARPAAVPKPVMHPDAVPTPPVHPAAVPKPGVHPVAAPQPAARPATHPSPKG